jgi:hypothetical protein
VIEEFTTLPASSETAPDTRINTLRAIQMGGKERMFIADLRGGLYEIVDQKPQMYLNVKEQLVDFIDAPGFGSGLGSFAFHPEFETNGIFYTTHTEPSKQKLLISPFLRV